jgi:putative transposase
MSGKAYSEISLHIIWHTKDSIPFINDDIEVPLFNFIRKRCAETPGAFCYAVGGTSGHIHVCVSIPPTLNIVSWVGEIKGASSHFINHNVSEKGLQWQTGYGVVSFGKNNLQFVKEYIENQKEHHSKGKVNSRLERIDPA